MLQLAVPDFSICSLPTDFSKGVLHSGRNAGCAPYPMFWRRSPLRKTLGLKSQPALVGHVPFLMMAFVSLLRLRLPLLSSANSSATFVAYLCFSVSTILFAMPTLTLRFFCKHKEETLDCSHQTSAKSRKPPWDNEQLCDPTLFY